MFLVVGLGNPGREYERHRHNVGFLVVDELARRIEADSFRAKFGGVIAKGWLSDDEQGWLLKPQTYMNLSGDSVQPCAAFFKIPHERVIVIHDEIDLPFETVRIKRGGGHAGNNGVRSIIGRMGPDFLRVRVGVGRPGADFKGDVASWVLQAFSSEEREKLPKVVEIAAKAVLDIATRGLEAAMKRRNTKPKKKKQQKPEKKQTPNEEADPSRSEDNSHVDNTHVDRASGPTSERRGE